MQSRVPVKNGNNRLYPAQITRELLLCATATTTIIKSRKSHKRSINWQSFQKSTISTS